MSLFVHKNVHLIVFGAYLHTLNAFSKLFLHLPPVYYHVIMMHYHSAQVPPVTLLCFPSTLPLQISSYAYTD